MINRTIARPSSANARPARFRDRVSWIWNRYVVFLIFIVALAELLTRMSGLSSIRSHFRTEVPLLLAVYCALNLVLRPRKLSPFVAAFPIVLVYFAFDLFYRYWGDVFKVIDAENLPTLLKVLPLASKAALLLALGLPVALVLWFVHYRRYARVLSVGALALLMVATVEFRPGLVLRALHGAGFQVAEWSDAETVNENGRFTAMLYFEAKRREALFQTATYRAQGDYEAELRAASGLLSKHGNHHNVHLVVLESFVDPTLFRGVSFSKDPRHPEFTALFGDNEGFSISPVFGGQSAQAEFEVLCGVPALQKLSEIEFDDFSGEPTGCMPRILRQAGYSTMVSNAFEPNYFNGTKAYTGIGFEQIYFPREYGSANASYLTAANVSEDEQYMFDGDLFAQNLAFVAAALHDSPGEPIFNYVLGTYGHEPHDIDTGQRPLVLSMSAPGKDDQLLRAVNQYWYRTQAIAQYVRALTRLDPNSLIIIVSDHLPPLDRGTKSYADFRYLDDIPNSTHWNRILIVENGKVVRHKTIHHYDIPSLIYDYLTGGAFCRQAHCDLSDAERTRRYLSLMAHAVGNP